MGASASAAPASPAGCALAGGAARNVEEVRRSEAEPEVLPTEIDGDPVVDVTLHFQEGEQYFVNRINFVGNSTTHDEVIRREVNLVERGVFNTEALRSSVRRINQLGYFDPLDEENAIQVDKRPGFDNEVDLTLEVAEANMNQLTFGAGASQFDGLFLQLSFQTTNFLGRGESLTLSAQTGERIKNYNAGFTEPFLFGKPITGGFNVYRRDIRFINQFTQSFTQMVETGEAGAGTEAAPVDGLKLAGSAIMGMITGKKD